MERGLSDWPLPLHRSSLDSLDSLDLETNKDHTSSMKITSKIPPLERFLLQVKRLPSGCLRWTGANTVRGYGRIGINGKTHVRVHRWIWEQTHGPVPPGMLILHSCDNPWCVEISHLRAGTQRDNMQDAVSRGRMRRSRANKPVLVANKSRPYPPVYYDLLPVHPSHRIL